MHECKNELLKDEKEKRAMSEINSEGKYETRSGATEDTQRDRQADG